MVRAKNTKVNASAKRLVELAEEYRRRKVWSGIPDSAVVLLRIESDSEPWIGAILGNGGIDEGLSLCRGAHSYAGFVDLQESLGQDDSVFDAIDVLILGYSPKRELPSQFCRILTQAGVRGDGSRLVPMFMARDAHSQARPLRQSDVRILTDVLRGLLACHKAGTIAPICCGPEQDQILQIRVENRGRTVEAERVPLPAECSAGATEPALDLSLLFQNLPELDTEYIVVRVRFPGQIENDDRAISAVSVLDTATDRIVGHGIAMGDAKQDVMKVLSDTLQGRGREGQRGRPRRMLFGDRQIFASLQSTLGDIGVKASYEPENPTYQAFRDNMGDFFNRPSGIELED